VRIRKERRASSLRAVSSSPFSSMRPLGSQHSGQKVQKSRLARTAAAHAGHAFPPLQVEAGHVGLETTLGIGEAHGFRRQKSSAGQKDSPMRRGFSWESWGRMGPASTRRAASISWETMRQPAAVAATP